MIDKMDSLKATAFERYMFTRRMQCIVVLMCCLYACVTDGYKIICVNRYLRNYSMVLLTKIYIQKNYVHCTTR